MKTTPARLRAWRSAQLPKLTLEAAGEAVGVTHSTWSEWESGSRKPSIEKAVVLEHFTDGKIRVEAWGFEASTVANLTRFAERRADEKGAA